MPLPASNLSFQFIRTPDHVLPTNLTSWKHAVHRWYNFIAGYSPEFVTGCITSSNLKPGSTVLDPFAGCGTTLVTALENGFNSVGYDAHPFFATIAKAKTQSNVTSDHIRRIGDILSSGLMQKNERSALSDDAWTFLLKLFPEGYLEALLGCRDALLSSTFSQDPVAFLILSRLVDECSSAQTDGIYKAPSSKKRAHHPTTALKRLVDNISHDIFPSERTPFSAVYNKSSEDMSEIASGSVDLVVTSPPYLNNFDYAEMTRMHLYFWGMATDWGDISRNVRSRLIVNTTTALKGHKETQAQYESEICPSILPEVRQLVGDLATVKTQRQGKKDYDYLLRPYMAQITRVYSEVFRSLRAQGTVHTIIADAAFYGHHIPSPQWLAETLEWIGFRNVECRFMRARGHRWILAKRAGSAKGLGEYHVFARK